MLELSPLHSCQFESVIHLPNCDVNEPIVKELVEIVILVHLGPHCGCHALDFIQVLLKVGQTLIPYLDLGSLHEHLSCGLDKSWLWITCLNVHSSIAGALLDNWLAISVDNLDHS